MIGFIAAMKIMPDHYASHRTRFDLRGYIMLAFAMVVLSLALDGISGLGTPHALVMLMTVAGLAALVGYWLHAANSTAPLFSLALFRVPSYRIGILGNLFSRIGSSAMPMLIPLLLQVGLGLGPMNAGLMMVPVAAAGMVSKKLAVKLVERYGYRRVLMVNTVLVGLAMASFILMTPGQHLAWRLLQLAFFGAVNSLQFTVMNTVTLRDLDREFASSGNSLLSMVMMLAAGFGAAAAGSLLAAFGNHLDSNSATAALHATFLCVGAITLTSTMIFWQLPDTSPNRGRSSTSRSEGSAGLRPCTRGSAGRWPATTTTSIPWVGGAVWACSTRRKPRSAVRRRWRLGVRGCSRSSASQAKRPHPWGLDGAIHGANGPQAHTARL